MKLTANEQIGREDEALCYLGQMLNADTMRVIADACQRYAAQTLGRDKSIAEDVARIMETGRN